MKNKYCRGDKIKVRKNTTKKMKDEYICRYNIKMTNLQSEIRDKNKDDCFILKEDITL